jgi:hypothetical protein
MGVILMKSRIGRRWSNPTASEKYFGVKPCMLDGDVPFAISVVA